MKGLSSPPSSPRHQMKPQCSSSSQGKKKERISFISLSERDFSEKVDFRKKGTGLAGEII